MTSSKNTKRALLASILSVVLCAAMLIGSTFAWFTDSVTSGKNKIVAGNLDVDLLYSKTMEADSWQSVDGQTDLFSAEEWEPGHAEVVYLKVANLGSLALDYDLAVTAVDTVIGKSVVKDENGQPKDIALSTFLKYGVVEVTKAFDDDSTGRDEAINIVADSATDLNTVYMSGATVQLLPKTESTVLAMVVYTPKEVGNEANHLTGTTAPEVELGVSLRAKQSVHEEDSFGNNYDANADWDAVRTEGELREAVAKGGHVRLMNDIALNEELYLLNVPELVLDGNGFSLTADEGFKRNTSGQYQLVKIWTESPVTLQNITLKHRALDQNELPYHTLDIYGSPAVTLRDVTLVRDFTAPKRGAPLMINGSNVTATGKLAIVAGGNAWYGADVDAKEGTALLDITGATVSFTGSSPLFATTENSGTILYNEADWIKVENGDNFALIPPAATVDTRPYATVEEAVENATDGSTVTVAGKVHVLNKNLVIDKDLTLKGEDGAVLTFADNATFTEGPKLNLSTEGLAAYYGIVTATSNAKVTLENLTIQGNVKAAASYSHSGYAAVYAVNADVTMTDCVLKDITFEGHLKGMQTGFGIYAVADSSKTLTLDNVVIENFNKAGIVARNAIELDIKGGRVTGWGKNKYICQNGIQFEGKATITGTVISDLVYDGENDSVALYNVVRDGTTSTSTIQNVTCSNVDYAIIVYAGGTMTVTDSTLDGEAHAYDGGTLTIQ